jgi:tetratricopeptide (TPR) repeat protein
MSTPKSNSPVLDISGTCRLYSVWLLAIGLLAFSCTQKTAIENELPQAGITLCGTVQFTDGCDTETDSLISYGLALTHHMTYEDAEKIFDSIIETTPTCFWGHWGKALTFIHPLWPDEPGAERMKLGLDLTQQALMLAKKPREKAFGEALAAYYQDGLDKTERERLKSLTAGWERAFQVLPEDLEVKAWYALSLIATAEATDKTYKNQLKAGQMAEEVLQVIPDHPGGFHYTIHAYDYPELANKAISAAKKYSNIAPDVPHALHMPSHIFTRLGMWEESIDWNTRSAKTALELPVGSLVSGHYFHAVDYIVYAHLQRAEDLKASQLIEEAKNTQGPYQNIAATVYTLAALEARYALERQNWKMAAALKVRQPDHVNWDNFPEYEALTYFAIGLGAARNGETAKAEGVAKRLEELKQKVSSPYWATQLEIQKNTVNAWLTFGKGKQKEALELMTLAANLENATNKHPITPGELLTASELLGDMLLELKKPAEALIQYEIALNRSPSRFNCLYGAARAAELSGDSVKAKVYYSTLVDVSSAAEVSLARRAQALSYLSGV